MNQAGTEARDRMKERMSEMKTMFDVLLEVALKAMPMVEQDQEKDHFCKLECREYKEQYCC